MNESKGCRQAQGSMLKHKSMILALALLIASLPACTEETTASGNEELNTAVADGRWYSDSQLAIGAEVFAANCAQCHGVEAQGLVADWRQKLEDGSFPPPPLNGTAHTWHHPQSVLMQVINNGGVDFGGKMPAFSSVLEEAEKLSAIAYFQSFWSDEIYQQWVQMGGNN